MKISWVSAALIAMSGAVQAATVSPVSYDMLNGHSKADPKVGLAHFDDSYNGVGDNMTRYSQLSGGLGDLTDGIKTTQSYSAAGVSDQVGANGYTEGPYVAWWNIDPEIVFNFAEVIDFLAVTFYFDNVNQGGVAAPSSVTINNITQTIAELDHNRAFTFLFDADDLADTDTLDVQINRGTMPNGEDAKWVFLSEVEFESVDAAIVPTLFNANPTPFATTNSGSTSPSPVPLPATGLMMLTALAGLSLRRLRKSET